MNKHQQEFIGKEIEVKESRNKEQEGLKGIVVDETKNTFTIRTKQKKVMIMKQGKKFMIENNVINGDKITKRPEDRIKIREK